MVKKVLFVGLGSAGQRHLRNLRKICGTDLEVMAYRVRKRQTVYNDKMQIQEGKKLDTEYQIKLFDCYEKALQERPDIAFITNQNSKHMEYALKAAKAGCHLFIEKPISDVLDGIEELSDIMKEKKRLAYVGYQNRLHPCIKKAKEILTSGRLGNIFMVYCEQGEYLPGMHPWEDYRGMNESNKCFGGGVVICQLHELDYLYYLFGMPEEVYSIGGKRSSLEIDVEDSCTALCRYVDREKEFAVNIHMDFLQMPPTRHCKIAGEFGRLEMDLLSNEYKLYLTDGSVERKKYEAFERNDMFLEELEIFLNAVNNNGASPLNLSEGKKSIEFALKLKESMNTRKIEAFDMEKIRK